MLPRQNSRALSSTLPFPASSVIFLVCSAMEPQQPPGSSWPGGLTGADMAAMRGPRINSATIAVMMLATVSVIVRFISRKVAKAGFWVRTSVLDWIEGMKAVIGC